MSLGTEDGDLSIKIAFSCCHIDSVSRLAGYICVCVISDTYNIVVEKEIPEFEKKPKNVCKNTHLEKNCGTL